MRTQLLLCFLLLAFVGKAAEVKVEAPAALADAVTNANDGDVLVLADGTYTTAFTFPANKTITIKAENAGRAILDFQVSDATPNGGGLIFDGVTIQRGDNPTNGNYFINTNLAGDISEISFYNCSIQYVGRCLIRTNAGDGFSIGNINFNNCIIKDCGNDGWNLIYPKHTVQNVSVKNSTLYNYTNGESFFLPNATNTDNVFTFLFENNTVYKWAKSSDRALCKTEGKYNAASTYTFRNNIVTEPGVSGQSPKMIDTKSGTVTATNNLIVNYGGYNGGTQTINDLTLGTGIFEEITYIPFAAPVSGNFSIFDNSPLATAGVDRVCLGDPRWIVEAPDQPLVTYQLTVNTSGSGAAWGKYTLTPDPGTGIYNEGSEVTVTANSTPIATFLQWSDGNTSASRTVTVSEDITLEAIFDVAPVIVAWTPTTANQKVNGGFEPDYNIHTEMPKLYVYDQDGNTNYGKAGERSGKTGYQISVARDAAKPDENRNAYHQVELSTVGYSNIKISSCMLVRYFSYYGQKLQYAIGDGAYNDLTEVITINASTWTTLSATLPAEADNQPLVKIRWYPDITGTKVENSTDGNETLLADIYLQAEPTTSTTHARSMYNDGGFETLCLPFDVTNITNGYGDEATPSVLYKFSRINDSELRVFDAKTEGIKANVPYLIKMPQTGSSDKLSYTFSGTAATPAADLSAGSGSYAFTGTYERLTPTAGTDYVLGGNGNEFVQAVATSSVPAYRAYLKAVAPSSVKQFNIVLEDGGATNLDATQAVEGIAIYSVENGLMIVADKAQTINIYNIDGRLALQAQLHAGENTVLPLAKGIYIVNNQKAIVK